MTRLAIVDDHEALREGLAALLAGEEVEVVGSVGNAAAALDLVEHVEADVALVDTVLPDGSGIDLARELVARRPGLRVLLYAGESDPDDLYRGLDSGAHGYALKVGALDELRAAIARVAGGATYVDPRLERLALAERAAARRRRLSAREREVLGLMAGGVTAEGVARRLGVSIETVRTHVRNAIRKLQARNRVHAIALALERGEVVVDEG